MSPKFSGNSDWTSTKMRDYDWLVLSSKYAASQWVRVLKATVETISMAGHTIRDSR
jgi:hypothetical protein